jgi:pyridoxamine 5'-phosphate oxidase
LSLPAPDPIARFLELQATAAPLEPEHATAATLATADLEGRPSARIVLVKSASPGGFVFYTNRESRKGRELDGNPWAALCFFWPSIVRQVRVEGTVERLDDAESDAYFASRERGSQVGAWASRQSTPLPSREALEDRVRHVEARFAGQPVPRPPFWGGYRLNPQRIEFWQGKESRLHDRLLYERDGDGWVTTRLAP